MGKLLIYQNIYNVPPRMVETLLSSLDYDQKTSFKKNKLKFQKVSKILIYHDFLGCCNICRHIMMTVFSMTKSWHARPSGLLIPWGAFCSPSRDRAGRQHQPKSPCTGKGSWILE
jgi:hypothetical protein